MERVIRHTPDLSDKPLALVTRDANRLFVVALSLAAQHLGLVPGMGLADARAACPELLSVPYQPHSNARFLKTLLRWATRYTPVVSRTGLDEILLDVTGCVHLFESQEELLRDIVTRLRRFGLSARVGAAPTPSAAWALAHYGKQTGDDFSPVIVFPERSHGTSRALRQAMAPLPIEALRLAPDVCACSRRLGFKTIGALFDLPRKSLALHLGVDSVNRLDKLIAQAPEPIKPARYKRAYTEARDFAEPVIHTRGIITAIEILLKRLCKRLECEQKGVRTATLCLERFDHHTHIITIQTRQPNRDAQSLLRLFARHLDGLNVGFGIEKITLKAVRVMSVLARHETSVRCDQDNCASLIDSLSNRFGNGCVLQFAPSACHIPERSFIAYPAIHEPPAALHTHDTPWPLAPSPRPLQLLDKPKNVAESPIAQSLAPPPTTIHWCGRSVAIRPLSGPERIEPQWWTQDPHWHGAGRDYWWVQTADGALLWLFGTAHPHGINRTMWCVHGTGS